MIEPVEGMLADEHLFLVERPVRGLPEPVVLLLQACDVQARTRIAVPPHRDEVRDVHEASVCGRQVPLQFRAGQGGIHETHDSLLLLWRGDTAEAGQVHDERADEFADVIDIRCSSSRVAQGSQEPLAGHGAGFG